MFETIQDFDGKMFIQKHSNEPIYILDFTDTFDFGRDMQTGVDIAFEILDVLEEQVYWILDLSKVTFSLDGLVQSTNMVTRGQQPLWKHPRIHQVLLISNSRLIQLAARGLESELFGSLNVKVFDAMEAAVEYATTHLAQEQ